MSCLGAPTRHLLMPRDPFQLSSVVTSQYSKTFFWTRFPENPLSHSPKLCLYGLRVYLSIFLIVSGIDENWEFRLEVFKFLISKHG